MTQFLRVLVLTIGLIAAVAIYYRLRLFFSGIKVTSWYRTPWRNKKVGGKPTSLHLIGWAFDVVPPTQKTNEKLKSIGFNVVATESDHVHVQIL